MLGDGARDGQALPLPAGHVRPALRHRREEVVRPRPDEVLGLRRGGGADGVGLRDVAAKLEVRENVAREEHALLRHVAEHGAQVGLVQAAHVHAADADRAAGRIVKARNEIQQRRFAAAGRADDGCDLAGPRREADVVQHVVLRAGIAERHMVERDGRVRGHGLGAARVAHARTRAQNFVHARGRDLGARQEHRHDRDHHEGHDDERGVGRKGDHVADLHIAGVDAFRTEPLDHDRDAVHDERHDRAHERHGPVDEQLRFHERRARGVEAFLLVPLAVERADDRQTGQHLAADEVDVVHALLHGAKLRHGDLHEHADEQQHRRDGQRDDPAEAGFRTRDHDNAAEADDRRIEHDAHDQHAHRLDLRDVVRGARDERGRRELVHLGGRERQHLAEHLRAQVAPDGGRHPRADKIAEHGRRDHAEREQEHFPAGAQQVAVADVVDIQARDGVLRLEKLHGRAVQDAVGERAHAAERFLAAREDLLVRDEAALHLLAQSEHGVRPLLRQAGIHDQRPDEDALQLRQLRRVVDRPDAVGIRVGGADRGGVVIRQKQAHAVHSLVREREGRGIFDAAALDAGVHDAARVRRQRQLAKRLRHEQQHDQRHGRDVPAQVFQHPHGASSFCSS